VTSSVSGRSTGCPGVSLNAPEGTSPGRTLPQGARGCLRDCGEWLPHWLPPRRRFCPPDPGHVRAGLPSGIVSESLVRALVPADGTGVRPRWTNQEPRGPAGGVGTTCTKRLSDIRIDADDREPRPAAGLLTSPWSADVSSALELDQAPSLHPDRGVHRVEVAGDDQTRPVVSP
jgi:hypothetical protein